MAEPAYDYLSIALPEQEVPMKDFHRRKMALRYGIAKELYRRGVPLEEIRNEFAPSQSDIEEFRKECETALLPETKDVEVIDVTPIEEPLPSQPSSLNVQGFVFLVLTILGWAVIFSAII